MSPPFLLALALLVSQTAFAQDAASRIGLPPRRIEYRTAALSGDPESPAAGQSSLVEIESYDERGRLILLARRVEKGKGLAEAGQSPAQNQAPAPTAVVPTAPASAAPAPTAPAPTAPAPAASVPAAPVPTALAPAAPALAAPPAAGQTQSQAAVQKAAPQVSFLYREFSYDRAGRLVMVTDRPGPGAPYSRRDILRRDADGRLVSLVVEVGGVKVWTLSYEWELSASRVLAVLRDASGALAAYDTLDLGGGAAGSAALTGTRYAPDGSAKEYLSAAVDSGGRLSFVSRRAPPVAAAPQAVASPAAGGSSDNAQAPAETAAAAPTGGDLVAASAAAAGGISQA
ncbi:MAG: hypothetical protein M0Z80_04105, partial [Treponema sp.]|nr:hypothetical protein [Treponema sp.]